MPQQNGALKCSCHERGGVRGAGGAGRRLALVVSLLSCPISSSATTPFPLRPPPSLPHKLAFFPLHCAATASPCKLRELEQLLHWALLLRVSLTHPPTSHRLLATKHRPIDQRPDHDDEVTNICCGKHCDGAR